MYDVFDMHTWVYVCKFMYIYRASFPTHHGLTKHFFSLLPNLSAKKGRLLEQNSLNICSAYGIVENPTTAQDVMWEFFFVVPGIPS
jgi:hypothetical protein